jgi:hypothetical protein
MWPPALRNVRRGDDHRDSRRTKSAASAGRRFALRNSMATFAPFGVPGFAEARAEPSHVALNWGTNAKKPADRNRRLLALDGNRPRRPDKAR